MTTSRTANADARRATQSRKTPVTKKAQLIRMLSGKAGTDVEVISKKLGWQNHTTRAAITGLKKAGYAVSTEKEVGKPTRYRILASDEGAGVDSRLPAIEANPALEPANAG